MASESDANESFGEPSACDEKAEERHTHTQNETDSLHAATDVDSVKPGASAAAINEDLTAQAT